MKQSMYSKNIDLILKDVKEFHKFKEDMLMTDDGKAFDINTACRLLNELIHRHGLIKDKLLNNVLDYDEISHSNTDFGLSETVEDLHCMVEELFSNPYGFKIEHYHYECDNYCNSMSFCPIVNMEVDEDEITDCDKFKWRF